METITLTFDIPQSKKMDGDQISELRREMASRLDKDLREAGVGKWSEGLQSLERIKIFLVINSCRKALPIIKDTLKDHWLFPSMKIRRLRLIHPLVGGFMVWCIESLPIACYWTQISDTKSLFDISVR